MNRLQTFGIVMATVMAFLLANLASGIALGLTPLPYVVTVVLQIGVGIAAAAGTWRFLRSASVDSSFVGFVLGSALVVGGIGFVAGFVGPMIFAPSANQGPLLGIFITGPAGVVLGALAGLVRWRAYRRAESRSQVRS